MVTLAVGGGALLNWKHRSSSLTSSCTSRPPPSSEKSLLCFNSCQTSCIYSCILHHTYMHIRAIGVNQPTSIPVPCSFLRQLVYGIVMICEIKYGLARRFTIEDFEVSEFSMHFFLREFSSHLIRMAF